jgi:preprotein translocase subunit SecY
MASKLLDIIINRGSVDDRRRRFFRGSIMANAIFLFVTSGIMVRLWWAIRNAETWRDSRGLVIGPAEFHRDFLFFGIITAIALVFLALLIALARR